MCNEKKIKKECCSGHENQYDFVDRNQEQEDTQDVECDVDGDDHAIDDCCQELIDAKDKYTHLLADMQNFRQRVDKERVQWSTAAQVDILKKLLPIVDNFDRAVQEVAKSGIDNQSVAGFIMIHKALLKMLASTGVEPIADISTFNPEKHEAIVQVDSAKHSSGAIVDVLENGYMFKQEVIRPAKVSVAR
ncbi:MAG: nucleotide exchange factor GrpE [Candidatus Dependentiae bacterium]|nr:nucleotide exchange factor GrpE [Candidatus Dependentiae bacterium]